MSFIWLLLWISSYCLSHVYWKILIACSTLCSSGTAAHILTAYFLIDHPLTKLLTLAPYDAEALACRLAYTSLEITHSSTIWKKMKQPGHLGQYATRIFNMESMY